MRVEKPKFIGRDGEGNFGAGMVGFSFRDNNLISLGICVFTREELSNKNVSHSFYTVDGHTIIEAEEEGVIISDPKKYFDNPHIHVFFKKPRNLNPEYVQKMTEYAFSLVGKGYGWGLFINFLYQWVCNKIGIKTSQKSRPLLDNPNTFCCSELTAGILNQIKEYSDLFPLNVYHPARISPILLFGSVIFKNWRY